MANWKLSHRRAGCQAGFTVYFETTARQTMGQVIKFRSRKIGDRWWYDYHRENKRVVGLEQRIWAHLLAPMKLVQDLAPDKLGSFAAGEASGHSDALALVQLISIYYLLQAREARQQALQEGLAGIAEG